MTTDTQDCLNWLETMANFALNDLFRELERGNLDAAKAHYERVQVVCNMVPWVDDSYVGSCPIHKLVFQNFGQQKEQ